MILYYVGSTVNQLQPSNVSYPPIEKVKNSGVRLLKYSCELPPPGWLICVKSKFVVFANLGTHHIFILTGSFFVQNHFTSSLLNPQSVHWRQIIRHARFSNLVPACIA